MPDETPLLEEKTRRRLDPLMLVASKVRAGAMKGERRSVKRGTSVEFADYRNYTPGDDLRRLDWNIYARLERPYVKLLEDEEDLAVHVLLDASASMDWPTVGDADPNQNKLLFGKRLLAGLAYTSLTSNDRLLLTAIRDSGLEHFGPVRGRGHVIPMMHYVQALTSAGLTDLNTALTDYALRAGRPGLCLLISDMFSPSGYLDSLNTLLGSGFEVALIHVLSPDEVMPPLAGDLRLVDVETGTFQEVSIDAGMRDIYIRRLRAWQDGIRADCARRDVHYLPVITDTPWDKVILYDLRRLGLVK